MLVSETSMNIARNLTIGFILFGLVLLTTAQAVEYFTLDKTPAPIQVTEALAGESLVEESFLPTLTMRGFCVLAHTPNEQFRVG